jgi:hypothetical protein
MNKNLWNIYLFIIENIERLPKKEFRYWLNELHRHSMASYLKALFPNDKRSYSQMKRLIDDEYGSTARA